jgi:hypothetical protein
MPKPYFAFLASPWATAELKSLRSEIHQMGKAYALPIWVAECEKPHMRPESGLLPFAIVDECMAAIRQARKFIFIADGSFGTALRIVDRSLVCSYIEMEIFQAAIRQLPVHVIRLGEITAESPLARLLEILKRSFQEISQAQAHSPNHALSIVEHMLKSEKSASRRLLSMKRAAKYIRGLTGSLALQRHRDWANVRLGRELGFLDDRFDVGMRRPDPDLVKAILADASRSTKTEQKLARTWSAIRELMGAPYFDPAASEYLPLWDRALSGWATDVAWYGMHAHLFLGHQAALGALLKIREREGTPSLPDAVGHTSCLAGALGSCYYSLSKIAPPTHAVSFLERSAKYVESGLNTEPEVHRSGLMALRGSIHLRKGAVGKAVDDYREALKCAERQPGMDARKGELLAELGWRSCIAASLYPACAISRRVLTRWCSTNMGRALLSGVERN